VYITTANKQCGYASTSIGVYENKNGGGRESIFIEVYLRMILL